MFFVTKPAGGRWQHVWRTRSQRCNRSQGSSITVGVVSEKLDYFVGVGLSAAGFVESVAETKEIFTESGCVHTAVPFFNSRRFIVIFNC